MPAGDRSSSTERVAMTREEVIRILREHEDELRERFGVRSLALFGSVVRDEPAEDSDIDLLVEFDERPVGLFHLSRLQDYLSELLGGAEIDLTLRRAVIDQLKETIYGEAVDVVR